MAALSIIVPVFNKEAHLNDCMESILNQSFKDFELILVNDGSWDGSSALCRQYQHADDRITLIEQENAGVSAARNKGLSIAKGSYVGFVDSDDTIETDMYELLMKNAVQHDADVSVCRLKTIFPKKTVKPLQDGAISIHNREEALSACIKGDFDRSANNKIYKSEIARHIQFKGNIYEDMLYTTKVFLTANKTVFANSIKYNYIVRKNSTSMSLFNDKYFETIAVSSEILKLVKQNNKNCIKEAHIFDLITNLSLLNLLMFLNREKYRKEYMEVEANIKSYKDLLSNSQDLEMKHRYAIRLFLNSPGLYKCLLYVYCKLIDAEVLKRTS